jgi:hypothetical protein
MAEPRPHPERPPPANGGRLQSKTLPSRAVRAKVARAGGQRRRDDEPPLLVESDLSGEMAVGDQELDAIVRLLGDALDDILSGTG